MTQEGRGVVKKADMDQRKHLGVYKARPKPDAACLSAQVLVVQQHSPGVRSGAP